MRTIKLADKTIKLNRSNTKSKLSRLLDEYLPPITEETYTEVLSGCPNTEFNDGDIINFVGPSGSVKTVVGLSPVQDLYCTMCAFTRDDSKECLGVSSCPRISTSDDNPKFLCVDRRRSIIMHFKPVEDILEDL